MIRQALESLNESTKLWLGIEHIDIKKMKDKIFKDFFTDMKRTFKKADFEFFYFEPKYDYKENKSQLVIKITDETTLNSFPKLFKQHNFRKTSDGYVTDDLVKVKLYYSKGMRGSGILPKKGRSNVAPSTSQQESGTIEYFNMMFQGKKPTAPKISEIVGYNFDSIWMYNFEQQWEAFSNFSKGYNFKKHTIFLDSEKNDSDVIVDIAKELGLKDSKDNWNPADIWITNMSRNEIRRESSYCKTLEEYNGWLKEQFYSRRIIGVSLKKVNKGKKGKHSIVTTDDLPVVDVDYSRALLDPFSSNFIFETTGEPNGFNIRVGYKASSVTSEKDIRIYAEGRMKGTSVQLGAVSKKFLTELGLENGFDLDKDRKWLFETPEKYINKYLREMSSKAILKVDKKTMYDGKSLVAKKKASYLVYFLAMFESFSKEQLKSMFYSASKMSNDASIHLKLY